MKRVLAFNYDLTGPDGNVLDASEKGQPLPYLEGAGQILPKLEEEIKGLKEGEKKTVYYWSKFKISNYQKCRKMLILSWYFLIKNLMRLVFKLLI